MAIKRGLHNSHYGKFRHGKIYFKSWESGIHQIKEQLDWKDSDFPEHIQKEIKKRKEQTKLNE